MKLRIIEAIDSYDDITELISADDVEDITLLSVEEVETLPKNVSCISDWYWLRTPGSDEYRVAGFNALGEVDTHGCKVNLYFPVRPAIKIKNLKSKGLKNYQYVKFLDEEWIVINELNYLLHASYLSRGEKFNNIDDGNDFNYSIIKGWLLRWLRNKLLNTYNKPNNQYYFKRDF